VINCPDFTWVNYPGQFMQLLFSCRQKPAKNPMQKLPKNPTKILYAKIFYDFLHKKPAKNFKYIQKLPNFTLNTNKTKIPCTT
jgi:hypothetical protein